MIRRLRVDLLTVIGWTSTAAAVGIQLAGRQRYGWSTVEGALTSLGAIAGLIAMNLMVLMLLLAARIPFVDRAVGHDRALAAHKELGPTTFIALFCHLGLLLAAWAVPAGGLVPAAFDLWGVGDIALAIIGVAGFIAFGASSITAARRYLPREVWFGIHLLSYGSIGLSIPHQFSTGSLLAEGPARVYWAVLLLATGAALLGWRVIRPLVRSLEQQVVVSSVRRVSADAVAITMTGRKLHRLEAQAGQFFTWRFWAPGLWWHAHPFSISSAPDGRCLTITVRALGRGSAALTRVAVGTKVSFEGPFGLFSPATRSRVPLVLAGAGVGVAPVKSLLEALPITPGRAIVIARGSSPDDLVHLSEIDQLCRAKGAQLFILTGRRGPGWAPAQHGALRLVDLAPWIAQADLYLCGPEGWGQALTADAQASGLDSRHIHHERFTW